MLTARLCLAVVGSVLLFGVGLCSPSWAGNTVYKDRDYDYEVTYPDTWIEEDDNEHELRLRVRGVVSSRHIICDVWVTAMPDTADLTQDVIDDWFEDVSLENLSAAYMERFLSASLVDVRRAEFKGHKAILVTFDNIPSTLGQSAVRTRYALAAVVVPGREIRLVCGAEQDDFAEVLSSFVLFFQSLEVDD